MEDSLLDMIIQDGGLSLPSLQIIPLIQRSKGLLIRAPNGVVNWVDYRCHNPQFYNGVTTLKIQRKLFLDQLLVPDR